MGMLDRFRRRHPAPVVRPQWTDLSRDGGWYGVAPITPVLRQVDPRVGPGLRFRDSLASWQDITFGSTLGHSVGPAAPVGTMHGVVRYRTPSASIAPAGGLLLLRSPSGTTISGDPAQPATSPRPGKAPAKPRRTAMPGNSATPSDAAALGNVPAIGRIAAPGETAVPDGSPAPGRVAAPGDLILRHGPVSQHGTTATPGDPAIPGTPTIQTSPVAPGIPAGPSVPAARPAGSTGSGARPEPPQRSAPVPDAPATGSPPGATTAVRPRTLGRPLIVARRIATLPVRILPAIRSTVEPVAGALPVVHGGHQEPEPRTGTPARSMTSRVSTVEEHSADSAARPLVADNPVHSVTGSPVQRDATQLAPGGPLPFRASQDQQRSPGYRPLVPDRPMHPSVSDVPPQVATGPVTPSDPAPERGLSLPLQRHSVTPHGPPGIGEPLTAIPPTAILLSGPPTSAESPAGAAPSDRPAGVSPAAGPPGISPSTGPADAPASAGPASVPPSAGPAMGMPVIQRQRVNALEPQRVTAVHRAAGVGPVPFRPAYRTLPLLAARQLMSRTKESTSDSQRTQVTSAVWRRTPNDAKPPIHPVEKPRLQPGVEHGVDLVAMAPTAPEHVTLQRIPSESAGLPSVLPVASGQRAPNAAGRPALATTSKSPAAFGRPLPVSTVVARAPDTTSESPSNPPPSTMDTTDGIDPEKLARQLIEPVSRLLRADLLRGRERAGRAHDRRR
jgi:hypothetical protein